MAWLHRAAREKQQPPPKPVAKVLADRPAPLSASEAFYWTAFSYLSSCRLVGMAIGEIPWTAIDAYAERHRLEPDVRDLFELVMHRMDAVYMEDQRRKEETRRKEAEEAAKARGSQGRGRKGR